MRSFGHLAAAALVAANAAGCTSANQRVAHTTLGDTQALVTTGSVRLVTQRDRPGFLPVVCTEPSPDYAVAFGSTGVLKGTLTPASTVVAGTPATGTGGNAEGSFTTTEEVTKGDGRAAAVLALRDGLYAACQSYANGIIGHDAYAMILSQYGHLLVALVGGGAAEAGRTAAAAVAIDAKKTTLSTLIVGCVSGHDATRYAAGVRPNRLLNDAFCRRVMEGALAQATAPVTVRAGSK